MNLSTDFTRHMSPNATTILKGRAEKPLREKFQCIAIEGKRMTSVGQYSEMLETGMEVIHNVAK